MALQAFALRDINPGEEITIAYLDEALDAPREKRQEQLKENWGFTCKCALCSADPEKIAISDEHRIMIAHDKEKLRRGLAEQKPTVMYRVATQMCQLYEDEGLIAPRAKSYEIAAYAAAMIGDENEVRRFANLAKRYWRILAGKDSFEVRKMDDLRRDPTGHPSWKAHLKVGNQEGVLKQGEGKNEDVGDIQEPIAIVKKEEVA
jgi:hypothetical protein